ncbi:MAG: MG2 domain-containing protein [Pseudomonadota bacterium]
MRTRHLGLILAGLLPLIAWSAGVEQFSPQGEVKGVRQATARFDADMVPLGDPRLPAPFEVACTPTAQAPGAGRWVDNRNWVYDFNADLPAGVQCGFRLAPGLKTLAGETVDAGEFRFTTGGPAIVTSVPGDGSWGIAEDQVFLLGLDTRVRESSLNGRLWCQAEGVAERIPARLVTGADRRKVLEAGQRFFQDYFYAVDRNQHSVFTFRAPGGTVRSNLLTAATQPDAPVVVARCARRLPADTRVSLVWDAGIVSASGVATRQAQTLAFKTRPEFTARLHCQKLNARAPCLPVLPMNLNFSAPVSSKLAGKILLKGAGKTWKAQLSPDDVKSGQTQSVTFPGPFPENASLSLILPKGLKDDAGRPLLNARRFPLALKTDLAPPLARFAAGFGIYELNAEPALPLTLRYVDPLQKSHAHLNAGLLTTKDPLEIISWMRRIRQKDEDLWGRASPDEETRILRYGAEDSIFEPRHKIAAVALPKPLPDKETEVIGIPLKGAGFHIVEVASPRLGAALMAKPKPYHVRSTALVTNLAIHFKLGKESSLAWITRLDDGRPVADAEVKVLDCGGKTHAQGRTNKDGLLRIAAELPDTGTLPGCLDQYDRQYFVTARTADDFSFLLSEWNDGISPWRFNLYQGDWQGPIRAHAVLDRGLYRAGEEVAMKLFVRRQKAVGFGYVEKTELGNEVILRHDGSGEEVKLPVAWNSQGIAEATYTLPKEAAQGTWRILVPHTRKKQGRNELEAGEIRVAAFRVPTMRARLSGPAQAVNPAALHLDMQASYLAGGAATGLPVTLRGQIQDWSVSFPDHENTAFANGPVKPGRQDAGRDWYIGDYSVGEEDMVPPEGQPLRLKSLSLKLDEGGAGRAGWDKLPPRDRPGLLQAEASYRDANGETRTAAARIPIYPAQVLAGVRPDHWIQARGVQRFRLLAVDPAGKPVAGVPLEGRLFQKTWRSYRKRVIGGFYAYEHAEEVTPLKDQCAGVSDAKGQFLCELRSPATGTLLLEARTRDAEGRTSHAHMDMWVPEGDGWVNASDNDRMDLVPEKRRYEIGETARLRLAMPFDSARVLVGVEREGVLDSWVTEVKRDNPFIQVPIKPEYGPNVFVTALAVRGRVAGVQPTAMVDLGKPAFRMGATEIQAGWSGYALDVKLETDKPGDKPTYKVRDKVKVKIQVKRPDGSIPKGAEVAVAAVDEGLLELAPNTSWKLLDAMMQRRGIRVTTSTAQMQVVGKRHFGRKAVASGGGGGQGTSARELFDTRVFWQARIPLDDQGQASVEVPLNDSLTRFRIVAVANASVGRFGTGETTVAVTQDLQLLSGAAPLVREGDRLKTYFTLRNTTDQALTVDISPQLNGKPLAGLTETLAPGQGKELSLPVDVPVGADRLEWDISAQARENPAARDRLKIRQTVKEAVPVRTLQATLAQLDGTLAVPVKAPADALPGRGGVGVRLQPKLAGNLAGVQDYMADYPWTCLEQQASKAVALQDDGRWQSIANALPAYLDRDGLAKYWPNLDLGSDTLTAYLLSIADAAGRPLPDGARNRMLDGLMNFATGRLARNSELATADLAVRKLAALAALARHADTQPEYTVRAEWLESFNLTPNLWPTSALLDWIDILARTPDLPDQATRLKEARGILRARLNFSGTVMGFSTERNDAWWWLMTHGDVNANRVILAALEDPATTTADAGRLMAGSLGRQQRGHWHTTVANAWGVVASQAFSDKLETQPVAGKTQAHLGDRSYTRDWNTPATPGLLPWPKGGGELKLEHQGPGRPWVTISSQAAVPLQAPLNAGYRITREVTPVSQAKPGIWQRGDVMRVKLSVDAQTDMGWVALLDPIPAGSTLLGTGLGGDSALLTAGEKKQGWVWPAYEERTHDSFRAYYRFVPKGSFSVEYTLRLNNEGRFNLPPARVEAMYAPELFGETPIAAVEVKP